MREHLDEISPAIADKLFLTNYRGAADLEALKRLRITHIAAVGEEFADDAVDGIVHWKKDITDDEEQGESMAASLRDAARFIDGAISGGGRCLVHCAAGISRSSTVVLAYYMLHRSLSLRDAFSELLSARRIVWPNDGFMSALLALELETRGASSFTIEEYIAWGDYEPPPQAEASTSSLDREGRRELAKQVSGEAVVARGRT